jgi:hypothetical protein
VKRTNLNIFYSLGKSLTDIHKVSAGKKRSDFVLDLVYPRLWLHDFIEQTKDMSLPETRIAARLLFALVQGLLKRDDWEKEITQEEVAQLSTALTSFERHFDEEHKRIAVFTVLQKGIYDMAALMDTPEQKFPDTIRSLLPEQMLYDLRQAARCLAFEIPTACAFHVCRGTEAVMLAYYVLLAKKPWTFKKRDWKIYIEQLAKEKAPQKITDRLDEIRALDRNTFIHPEVNVTLEEAPILFELCTGVVFQMGQEMEKLRT